MNPLLARIGHLDSRRAVQTLLHSGKRNRADWVCATCRGQRRSYSDDTLRWPGGHGLEEQDAREEGRRGAWGAQWAKSARLARAEAVAEPATGDTQEQHTPDKPGIQNSFFDRHIVHEPTSEAHEALLDSDATPAELDPWEQVYRDRDVHDAGVKYIDTTNSELPIPQDSLLSVDYQVDLNKALKERSADLAIRCLFSATQQQDVDFISNIPPTTFSAILKLVEPAEFLGHLSEIHAEISYAVAESIHTATMREIAYQYSGVLLQILGMRRKTGQKLNLADYKSLLRGVRLLGSNKASTSIWRSLKQDGVRPDTECYNHYMASIVWNGVHSPGSRQKTRVTPFNMKTRSTKRLKMSLGPRFGNYSIAEDGVKERTMNIFSEMLASGAVADHESFRVLITACAREGDIDTVKAILQRVWGIDVKGIMESKDEAVIAPMDFPENSPLRPQPSLLSALAHAFGINNDLPAALRVVDFIARQYQLDIPAETWAQLLEWTFVHAKPRTPHIPEYTGQLPPRSVQNLWDTMIGAPYFVKPTLNMYSRLIKSHSVWQRPRLVVKAMDEAMPILQHDDHAAVTAQDRLIAALQGDHEADQIERMRQEWERARMILRRNTMWAERWVRLLLSAINNGPFWTKSREQQVLELPSTLWRWRTYAPNKISYETATGFVELEFRSEEDRRRSAAKYHDIREKEEKLKLQTRRYVGNDWLINGLESSPEQEAEARKRAERVAIQANRHDRRLIEEPLSDSFGGLS